MQTISDMLIQIKNAQAAGRDRLVVPFSKMRWEVARVLQEAGFVQELDKKKKKARKLRLRAFARFFLATSYESELRRVCVHTNPNMRALGCMDIRIHTHRHTQTDTHIHMVAGQPR